MDLATEVYRLTGRLPAGERFGLTSQMQRAAVSVPSNIAEGHERRSAREYRRFLAIASASLAELETQLHLCCRVGHLEQEAAQRAFALASEVGRTIRGIDRAVLQRSAS
jgi:four helix bundle protein